MYEFRVHQEVPTANRQAVTFATDLLSPRERSNAFQVLCRAPGWRVSSSRSHREPIPAHG